MDIVKVKLPVLPKEHRDEYEYLYEELLTHMPRAIDRQHWRETFNREALLKAFAEGRVEVQTDFIMWGKGLLIIGHAVRAGCYVDLEVAISLFLP